MNSRIGSSIDSLFEADGNREELVAIAVKRVIAWQLSEAMKAKQINKSEMANRMHTARSVVNRLLDANDTSVTLATLIKASLAVDADLTVAIEGHRPVADQSDVGFPSAAGAQ